MGIQMHELFIYIANKEIVCFNGWYKKENGKRAGSVL